MIITKAGNKYVITDTSGNFYASTYSSYDAHLISLIPEMRKFVDNVKDEATDPHWLPVDMTKRIQTLCKNILKEINSPCDL